MRVGCYYRPLWFGSFKKKLEKGKMKEKKGGKETHCREQNNRLLREIMDEMPEDGEQLERTN